MSMLQIRAKWFALAGIAAVFAIGRVPSAQGKPISWKTIDDALLRVNDNPVKEWSVYQAGNKQDPLLLQMGNRFLLFKIHDRQLFEVAPSKIQTKAGELRWDPADHPAEPIATSDWDASDTEAVFRIRAKITGENRLLDLELPHQLDLSGMAPRSAASPRHR